MVFQLKIFSFLLLIALSVVLAILPSKGLEELFVTVAEFFSLTEIFQQYTLSEITNIGHSIALFLITLSGVSTFPKRVVPILITALGVSVGLEYLQLFESSRTASWGDLNYDLLGIGCAMLMILLFYAAKRLLAWFTPAIRSTAPPA